MPIEINKKPMHEAKTLEHKVLTDKEKLAALLRDKGMPAPLIPRLVAQGRHSTFTNKDALPYIVLFFCPWHRTNEGAFFWYHVFENMSWLETQKARSIADSANAGSIGPKGSINNASPKGN